MARDRLAELNQNSQQGRYQENIPMSSYPDSNSNTSQNDFLGMASQIKDSTEQIKLNTRDLRSLHKRALGSTQAHQSDEFSRQIDSIIDQTSRIIAQTRSQLKTLLTLPGADPKSKKNQQKALANNLMKVAQEYQGVQQDAKKSYRAQLERQYKIARPNASDAEVANAIDNSNGNGVFQQQILSSRVQDQRRVLGEVENRQHALQNIEKSLMQLFDLMQDMQVLLEEQGTMINSIEDNVESAAVHVEDGSKELSKGVEHAKSARKKKWICFWIFIVLLIIVGIVIYLQVIKPIIDANNAVKNGDKNEDGDTAPSGNATVATSRRLVKRVVHGVCKHFGDRE
jgi:syntaxin 1B/2/3